MLDSIRWFGIVRTKGKVCLQNINKVIIIVKQIVQPSMLMFRSVFGRGVCECVFPVLRRPVDVVVCVCVVSTSTEATIVNLIVSPTCLYLKHICL